MDGAEAQDSSRRFEGGSFLLLWPLCDENHPGRSFALLDPQLGRGWWVKLVGCGVVPGASLNWDHDSVSDTRQS